MHRDELAQVVRDQVAQVVGVSVAEIQESTDLRTAYDLDSLELMEIGAGLERALGTRLEAGDLLAMRNVGDAVDALFSTLRERS
jgi:acyl carrier protein